MLDDFLSGYYNTKNVSNSNWTTKIFEKIDLSQDGSLVLCLATCFFGFSPRCKIIVFMAPYCYLGDPFYEGATAVTDGTQLVYAKYGIETLF